MNFRKFADSLVDRLTYEHAVVELLGFLCFLDESFIVVEVFAELDSFTLSSVFRLTDPVVAFDIFALLGVKVADVVSFLAFVCDFLLVRVDEVGWEQIFMTGEHFPKKR